VGNIVLNISSFKRWQLIVLIILLLLPLYFLNLGNSSLWDLDEGVYAEMAREMVLRDDYINTFFNYQVRFDKPPLVLWITAFFYNVFGISEFTARLGIVFFSLLNLIIIYLFAEKLFNQRTATLSVLIMGTSFQYLIQSRIFYMDVPLTFLITLSLYLFYLAYKEDRRFYLLAAVALGLGTLVKGPVALGLPGLIILIYLGPVKFIKEFKYKWTYLSMFIYLLIALPWHILLWNNYGSQFLDTYFGYHMFTRFSQAIESHGGPWYYYLAVIFLGLFPWSAFLPWQVGLIKNKWKEKKDAFKFLLSWFLLILVFFSIASTKLPGYILPTYPVLVFLIAYWWDNIIDKKLAGKKYIFSSSIIILIGLILLSALFYLREDVINNYQQYIEIYELLFFFPLVFIIGGVLALLMTIKIRRPERSFIVYLIISYISLLILIMAVIPGIDQAKPIKILTQPVREYKQKDIAVASAMQMEAASTVYYTQREVKFISGMKELRTFLDHNPRVFILADEADYQELKSMNSNINLIKSHAGAVLLSNFELNS